MHLARTLRPDVVVMDVRMPQVDGIRATRALAGPDVDEPVAVLIVTTFDLDEYVFGALTAGASGFLLKNVSPRTCSMRCARSPPETPWWRRAPPGG